MTMLKKDPLIKMLKVKMQGPVHGPVHDFVTALPTMTTDLEVLKALLNFLQEARMVAGNFRVKTLFDFGFKVLKKTLVILHGNLKAMVGQMSFEEMPRSGGRSAVPGFTCRVPLWSIVKVPVLIGCLIDEVDYGGHD